jgi:hypothetical protein
LLESLDPKFKALKDLPWRQTAQAHQAHQAHQTQQAHQAHQAHQYIAKNQNIKQRKNEQLLALISHLPEKLPSHILEWCGGKGFLSRLLRIHQKIKTSKIIDWDADLIRAGRLLKDSDLEDHLSIEMDESAYEYQVLDAMSLEAIDVLHESSCIFAIHACGCLHRKVIEHANKHQHQTLIIAPCCYHLDTIDDYVPMSVLAKSSESLDLNRYLLRLATQQRTHASERRQQLRQRAAAFRLGFEQLLIHLGKTDIKQLPSLSRAEQRQSFKEVCLSFAKVLMLAPDLFEGCSDQDYDRFERLGHERLLKILPLEHMRHVFRKSLEYYLCLDRSVALVEKGFDVQLVQFCDVQITPRNLMIVANSNACHST